MKHPNEMTPEEWEQATDEIGDKIADAAYVAPPFAQKQADLDKLCGLLNLPKDQRETLNKLLREGDKFQD